MVDYKSTAACLTHRLGPLQDPRQKQLAVMEADVLHLGSTAVLRMPVSHKEPSVFGCSWLVEQQHAHQTHLVQLACIPLRLAFRFAGCKSRFTNLSQHIAQSCKFLQSHCICTSTVSTAVPVNFDNLDCLLQDFMRTQCMGRTTTVATDTENHLFTSPTKLGITQLSATLCTSCCSTACSTSGNPASRHSTADT